MGISVIMPSYLGEYPGSRSNPGIKFIRAVRSFLTNTIKDKELIIVSDGCEITNKLYKEHFEQFEEVKLISVEKRKETWPGELRECGRSLAKYNWISYLDSDDALHPTYLEQLVKHICNNPEINAFSIQYMLFPIKDENYVAKRPWFLNMTPFSNLQEYIDFYKSEKGIRINFLNNDWFLASAKSAYGTWAIIHKKNISVRWENSNEMGEDTDFIHRIEKIYGSNRAKVFGYIICHLTDPGNRDKVSWDI